MLQARPKSGRRIRSVLPLFVVCFLATAGTSWAVPGELTQLPGTAGCLADDGLGGECANIGEPFSSPTSLAVSPDGKHVYAADQGVDAVLVFSRDQDTGALTPLSGTARCVSDTGSSGACADGVALDSASGVTVSADGKNVYVASSFSDAVAVFSRDETTGALTQLAGTAGCVSQFGGACADGEALDGALTVRVSPDGQNAYVTSYNSDAIAVFSRDPSTGALTQLTGTAGCVSETGTGGACADGKALDSTNVVAISADGKNAYVSSNNSYAVAVFSRDATTGALTQLSGTAGCVSENGRSKPFDATTAGECTDGKALASARSVAVSPDGASVYVASQSDAVAVLSRDPGTGVLTPLAGASGCVSEFGSGGACANGAGLQSPYDVTVSPDSQNVYVVSDGGDAVAVFTRDLATGALTQLGGTAGCVSDDGSGGACVDGRALAAAQAVTVSPDGKNVYVAAPGLDAAAIFAREQAAAPPPSNSAPPAISGNAVDGETLTCDPGSWSGSPSLAFEWLRDGTLIPGATSSSYTLGPADVGTQVTCRVTATNAGGSSSATSSAVAPTAKPQPTEPQPESRTGVQPQPDVQPQPACDDRTMPLTSLLASGVKRRANKLTLRGRSSDSGGNCPASGIGRVQVSLARVSGRTGTNCRFLRSRSRFQLTSPQDCRRPVLFEATGTSRWSFDFNVRLKPGKYRVQARAVDAAGNKETPRQRRSIVLFTVR